HARDRALRPQVDVAVMRRHLKPSEITVVLDIHHKRADAIWIGVNALAINSLLREGDPDLLGRRTEVQKHHSNLLRFGGGGQGAPMVGHDAVAGPRLLVVVKRLASAERALVAPQAAQDAMQADQSLSLFVIEITPLHRATKMDSQVTRRG